MDIKLNLKYLTAFPTDKLRYGLPVMNKIQSKNINSYQSIALDLKYVDSGNPWLNL